MNLNRRRLRELNQTLKELKDGPHPRQPVPVAEFESPCTCRRPCGAPHRWISIGGLGPVAPGQGVLLLPAKEGLEIQRRRQRARGEE